MITDIFEVLSKVPENGSILVLHPNDHFSIYLFQKTMKTKLLRINLDSAQGLVDTDSLFEDEVKDVGVTYIVEGITADTAPELPKLLEFNPNGLTIVQVSPRLNRNKGYVHLMNSPKVFLVNNPEVKLWEFRDYVSQRLVDRKLRAEPKAIDYLAIAVAGDQIRLEAELDKMQIVCMDSGGILEVDCRMQVHNAGTSDVYQGMEALFSKRPQEFLGNMRGYGDPVALVRVLLYEVTKMLQISGMVTLSTNVNDIAGIVGINKYILEKRYLPLVKTLGIVELSKLNKTLLQLDTELLAGVSYDPYLLIEARMLAHVK